LEESLEVVYSKSNGHLKTDRGLLKASQIKLCGDFVNDLLKTPLKIKIKKWT
jgi:hypothetical protein